MKDMAEKKRPVGRPSKKAVPPAKKAKTASTRSTPKEQTPVVDVEEADERQASPLPNKVVDSKPLPTLSKAQSLSLADDEYQSIANR